MISQLIFYLKTLRCNLIEFFHIKKKNKSHKINIKILNNIKYTEYQNL